jgi:DNA repair protein RecO (recombination protein O)
MAEFKTPAIVLKVRDYGEADRLVTFLTPGRGRLTGIAKHAKKSRRRFANCLEPLNQVTFFLSPRAGELEFIQRGELVKSYPGLRRDLPRLGAASVLAELAGELAAPPEATAEMFATLEEALDRLEAGDPADSLLPPFLLHLLRLGGYGPRWDYCLICGREPGVPIFFSIPRGGVVCGPCSREAGAPLLPLTAGAWKLLRLAQTLPRRKLARLRFPPRQSAESLALLKNFLRRHLGRELKSWSFWEKFAPGVKEPPPPAPSAPSPPAAPFEEET